MATFAIKCPHCLRDNTSFTVAGVHPHHAVQQGWMPIEVFATCNACQKGVCSTVRISIPSIRADFSNVALLVDSAHVKIGEWLPRSPGPDIPDHLPAAVLRAFTEAEQLKIAGFRGPAGNAYRRALEAGLKQVDASLKGSLYSRIEALANQSLLTPSLKEFAHRIRTLGNEASHETPLVEDDEIDDLAIFTKLFLMYQFTLPGMLPQPEAPQAAIDAAAATG
ncbi:DUF4145 domain-containing protein [Burkholderia orbicola]|uniref:DUF4145 domain-containing protein n=1 Tax=Burkholderia orbicola TaxID=2978683 RepID=UPI00264BC36E|nr:DUF4145 domain-containing protein [Burkholderia orbicola]MDN7582956.1 DUF4145 domain-containing protein [Burkholderia orbicola]